MSVKWSPEYDSAADAWFIRSDEQRPEGSTIAHVFTGEGDARLMASAPELQAEVERLRDALNSIYKNVECWNTLQISSKIRAALQRNEGDE